CTRGSSHRPRRCSTLATPLRPGLLQTAGVETPRSFSTRIIQPARSDRPRRHGTPRCSSMLMPRRNEKGDVMKTKATLAMLLLVLLNLSGFAQEKQAEQTSVPAQTLKPSIGFGLEDGTPIRMRISRTISSADAQVDEKVDFEILEDIKVGDTIVVPRGGIAWGTITEAQPKRRMGRAGKLNVNIDAVRLMDGEKAALRAVKEVKGGGHTGAMTGAIVATSIVFFPAAPLFLFMHGKDITIPKGTEITAYVNGDIKLDQAKFIAKSVAPSPATPANTSAAAGSPDAASGAHGDGLSLGPGSPAPASAAALTAEPSTVAIKSTPDGADITIDGKFIGNTPSTVKLAPGDHTILIEKSGFKTWQRKITVSPGGNVNLDTTLEKPPRVDSDK